MNKTTDIINLPVIDISEGIEIGFATKIVINPIEGSIAALVIDDGKWYKLLPFSAISGIGTSAITILSSSEMVSIENAPALEQLLYADIHVIGTKVLTKAGSMQGIVKEFVVDITGKIVACEMEELTGEISNIPVERIMTFGKKVLVVTDENDTSIKTADSQMLSISETPVTPVQPVTPVTSDIPEIPVVPETKISAPVKENTNDDSAKKFDEKQRRYLLGKQASRRIETDNGVVIVEQGGEINEEVLQKAKLAGKFVELSMNIQ